MSNYTGRPMAPIDAQLDLMKAHVSRGVAKTPKRDTDQHTFVLANPADWTKHGLCVVEQRPRLNGVALPLHHGDFMLWDEPVGLSTGEAAKRCEGCPVIAECLAAAMTEEGTLTAPNRYTIRGGKSPKERAALAGVGKVDRARKRAKYEADRLDPDFMARRAAELRENRSARCVTCLECKAEMRAAAFPRHLSRRHGIAA